MAAIARSTLLLAAALLLAVLRPSTAQSTECASKLVICADDLGKTTKPSAGCCTAINETVTTQLTCLCGILNTPDLLKSFNISVSQALQLPKRCGIAGDTSLCNNKTSPPPSGSGGTGNTTPPGTPSTPKGNNAAFAVTWIGTYGLMVLLALSWSIVS